MLICLLNTVYHLLHNLTEEQYWICSRFALAVFEHKIIDVVLHQFEIVVLVALDLNGLSVFKAYHLGSSNLTKLF